MTHLTDLQCSMYADEALPGPEADMIMHHMESCSVCQSRIAEFIDEKRLIGAVLSIDDVVVPNIATPKFDKPVSLRNFAIANVITGLFAWLVQFLWKTVFGELIASALAWITLITLPDVYGLLVSTALYFSKEGTTMIENYLGFFVISLFIVTIMWLALSYRKARATLNLCFLAVIGASLLAPPTANALEHRHSEDMLTIATTETIDDTLILTGETVVIDGTINGDLIAFAHRVIVNGTVAGNLVVAAEAVTISGRIDGSVLGAASLLEINDAIINGDLWGAADNVTISGDSRIGGNAIIASEMASISGAIERDLIAAGNSIEISGTVGEDLEAFTNRVGLLGNARIDGNLRFRTNDEKNLRRSSTSTVNGKIEILPRHSKFKSKNKYVTGRFYIHQLLRLVSAFIAGIVLLWFIPELRDVTLGRGIEGLKTAGIGLVTLISLPIIVLLFAVTVIGLPLSVVGAFFWLLAIYFAKIVLASMIGSMLLSSSAMEDSLPLTLLAGLVVILVTVNLPMIGGILSFILTIIGIGMIVQMMLFYISSLEVNQLADR